VYLYNRAPNVLPKYGKTVGTVGGGHRGIACIALAFIQVPIPTNTIFPFLHIFL
jgi:hypothetical protein